MIEVRITRRTVETYKETVNFETSSVPTEILENADYGNTRKVCRKTTSEPREVTKYKDITKILLVQEIEDETEFHLGKVIAAVNGM